MERPEPTGRLGEESLGPIDGIGLGAIYLLSAVLCIFPSVYLAGILTLAVMATIGAASGGLEAFALAKLLDVRHVMAPVPGVERDVLLEPHPPELGVNEAARILFVGEGTQENYPALVK